MSLSIFGDKATIPKDEMLAETLSEAEILWKSVIEHIQSNYKNTSQEWKFYSKAAGWTLVIKTGKRTLTYLIPLKNSFKINFVFGEKAVEVAKQFDLPEPVITSILEAKQYMEGRSFMLDITKEEDIKTVQILLKIKNDN